MVGGRRGGGACTKISIERVTRAAECVGDGLERLDGGEATV